MSRLLSEDATKYRFAGLEQSHPNILSAAKQYFVASAPYSRDIYVMVSNALVC